MIEKVNAVVEEFGEVGLLDEPQLVFGFSQSTAHPKDGLLWFGPLTETQPPVSLRIGLVGSESASLQYRKWVESINLPISPKKESTSHHIGFPGFEAIFGCKWPKEPVCKINIKHKDIIDTIRIKDRYQAIYNTVSLFESEISRHILEEDVHVDLWFVVIPEEVYTFGRPQSRVPGFMANDSPQAMNTKLAKKLSREPSLFEEDNEIAEIYKFELNFHNQLKARLLNSKAVIQVVRDTTLVPEEFEEEGKRSRQLQDAASVAWNLCTTAYFKSSGRPWKIANVREGVCYVGLVFKIDETKSDPNSACCGAQMFLDSGDGLVFKGAVGPWYTGKKGEFHIPYDKAKSIAETVVAAYKRDHGVPPKELFIHGKTRITQEEWDGFSDGVPEDTNIVSIRIRNDNQTKLYGPSNNPMVRGSYLKLHERKGYLWTKGFVPRLETYQGREVPNPLSVEICFGEASIIQVFKDILGLTKVNFNRCDYSDGEPVTLRFADQVGEILTATPDAVDVPPLPFKHYI